MASIYVTAFMVRTPQGVAIELSVAVEDDPSAAKTKALQTALRYYPSQEIKMMETILVSDEIVDQAYESRH